MTLTMDALTHHVLVTTVGGDENPGPVAVTPAPARVLPCTYGPMYSAQMGLVPVIL